jgi:glycerophosphoryl diester phosphodiesterase
VSPPLILAHRGDWSDAGECTIPAFLAAGRRSRVDGVEFDVRAARDGTPVVIHDGTLLRSHGMGRRVRDCSVDELRERGVPALRDVLRALPPPFFLDIELKEDVGSAAMPIIAESRGDPPREVAVSSFAVETIARVKAASPAWRCWLITRRLDGEVVRSATSAGCDGLAVRWPALTRSGLARAVEAGLEVATWTVSDPATLRTVSGLGLVAVCVDPPALP